MLPSSSDQNQTDSLIAEIMGLLAQVSEKFEPGENDMKQWMMKNFHKKEVVEILQDSTIMTLRVLDVIGRLEPVNGITISKQSRIPKGSVSKITRRMIARKMITKELLPNNRKEILFRTTLLGKEIFLAHQAFDEHMAKSFTNFLKKYKPHELQFMVQVLQDFVNASFPNLQQES